MLTKQEVKKIRKLKGEVRGSVFQTDLKYLEEKMGKEKAKKVREGIKKIEPEFDTAGIKNTDWLPLYWRVLSLLVIKDVCDWKEKDIYEMGRHAPQNSFIVKVILRYFTYFKKTCQEAYSYWEKHYSRGELETVEFNDSEKFVIFRLRKFKPHPLLCIYLTGFFQGMAEMTNPKGKNIETKETKCMFQGDKYHEFIIEWE